MQVAVQVWAQQTPSEEQVVPLMQFVVAPVHDWPFFSLQAPVLSQVPLQLSVSSAFVTVTQA